MTAKRSIRDLERQCKKEPDNLVVRLLLAAAYREAGRTADAIPLYRSVAAAYQQQGRRTQAVAVLKSLMEIDPEDPESRQLLDTIDQEQSRPNPPVSTPPPLQPPAEPTPQRLDSGRPSTIPSLDKHKVRKSTPVPRSDRTPTGASGVGRARVLADEVEVRELSPVPRPPGVPATPLPPARPVPATLGGIGPPPRSILGAPRLPTPTRGSAPLYTPTPLPTPIPFHEADHTADRDRISDAELEEKTRVAARSAPMSDGAAPERGAVGLRRGTPPPLRPVTSDAVPIARPQPTLPGRVRRQEPVPRVDTEEKTQPDVDLAADLETRRVRRLSEHELSVLPPPPSGQTDLVPRLDPDADPVTDPDPAARLPNEFEGPTDVRDRPKTRTTRRPAPQRRSGRGLVSRPTPTPTTNPRAAPEVRSPTSPGTDDTRDTARDARRMLTPAPPEETTDVHEEMATRISEPGMHRSQTFSDSFVSTLDEMDPDGAAIESPLDMFSMLPPAAVAELGRRMTLRRFGAGQVIIREGDTGDACYVIADGEVRVLKSDPLDLEAGPVEVARLGTRSLFGEFAVLADRRRHATVQATAETDVYEIPRQVLRDLAATFPGVAPALESFYRQRLLATLLRTAPFFTPLAEEHRARLLARFVPIRAEAGEAIVREGQPAGGLYLIVLGTVEITRRLGRQRSVILATLREGAYFGEMSLLSGDPTSATVVATGPVELALLPPRDFYEVVSEHPQLWASIRREARTRAMVNARLLAGETGSV